MNCPQCESNTITKNGFARKHQRYLCKECNYQFTQMETKLNYNQMRFALELYLEGLSLREISNYLPVSHVSIYNWLKDFNPKLDEIRSNSKVGVISIKITTNQRLINIDSNTLLINFKTGKSNLFTQ